MRGDVRLELVFSDFEIILSNDLESSSLPKFLVYDSQRSEPSATLLFTHTCHDHLHVKFFLRHRSYTHGSFYGLYQFLYKEIILEELKTNNDKIELICH